MKFALCLHGLSAKSNDKKKKLILLDIGYKYIKTELLDKYDIDVFVHTWDNENEEKIMKYYNPKKSIFVGERSIKNRYLSSLYSYKMVNNLRKQYEKENKMKYDSVILTRFDLAIKIYRNLETFDMNKFYICEARLLNTEYEYESTIEFYKSFGFMNDLILMSNGENIDKWCEFYNHYDKFVKMVKNGYIITRNKKVYVRNLGHHVFMKYMMHPSSGLNEALDLIKLSEIYVHKPQLRKNILPIPNVKI